MAALAHEKTGVVYEAEDILKRVLLDRRVDALRVVAETGKQQVLVLILDDTTEVHLPFPAGELLYVSRPRVN